MEMRNSLLGLILWLVTSLAAGWIGSRFMPGAWYVALAKPSWTPPSAVFGPVWSALYVLMGVAAWLVWRRAGFAEAPVALGLFIAQLVLNALWSYLFFGLHQPGVAFIDIVVLWLVILGTVIGFWRVLCWVSFASALNLQLWRLNA